MYLSLLGSRCATPLLGHISVRMSSIPFETLCSTWSKPQTINIMQLWKPAITLVDETVVFVNSDALDAYVKARIVMEVPDRRTFGLSIYTGGMNIFMCEYRDRSHCRINHCLWSRTVCKPTAFYQLKKWHDQTFKDTILDISSDVDQESLSAWFSCDPEF